MTTPNVPERIAAAASARIHDPKARQQRERVEKANESGNLLSAEPDLKRKVRRLGVVADVGEDEAKSLAKGASPRSLGVEGGESLAAERIQGKTTDFVDVSFLDSARAAAGCVARVIHRDGSPIGSGFLISERLFLTNNHVLSSEAEVADALLEFNYERDHHRQARVTTRFALDPRAFFLTNVEDDLDCTVVAVGGRHDGPGALPDFGFCPIFDSDDKHILGEFVNIIQHPEGDYKQVVLRENQLTSRLDTVLHYLADTAPGSSGSPVFNDQWEVVALHHYGEPFRQTVGLDGRPVSLEVNEGIRVSAIVKFLSAARPRLSREARSLLDAALNVDFRRPSRADLIAGIFTGPAASRPDPYPTTRPPETSPLRNGKPHPDEYGTVTVTVPLQITVRLGTEVVPAQVGNESGSGVEGRERVSPDRWYANREGYDPDFLAGFPVPFPKVTRSAAGTPARLRAPIRGEDPTILKYEHFSTVMNADRKMAFVTAANIDGAMSRSVNRDTGKARPGIAERITEAAPESAEATETWYDDPRIPAEAQSTQALYSNQRPRVFDRGHLVRREDPNWGTDESAERANADTFHFTNCCPQASTFNQRAEFWQGIENYVLNNARSEDAKVSVFTGPVFAPNDPRYRDVRVPVQFFKIVALVEAGTPKAIALLASQAEFLNRLPERLGGERFGDLGRVQQYQTTVEEIEEMTGLDFGPLRDADTLAQGDQESIETGLRPLRSFEDLRLGDEPSYRRAMARRH